MKYSYSTQIKFKKIRNVRLCHDSPHLNIDNSRIKSVTAKSLCIIVLTILVKCVQISSYLDEKQKSYMDFSAKVVNLRKRAKKIMKSVMTHSIFGMER